jgi:hypothetical protein
LVILAILAAMIISAILGMSHYDHGIIPDMMFAMITGITAMIPRRRRGIIPETTDASLPRYPRP